MSSTINLDDSDTDIEFLNNNNNNNSEVIVLNSPAPPRTNSNALQAIVNTTILDAQSNRGRFNEDDEDDYSESRSKIPRLTNDSDVKTTSSNKENNEKVEEEEVCSICLDPWTNSGIHRIVCLRCGHLFGEGCIERWLQSNQKCPQCNLPSTKKDIRRIYAKAIKVLDTTELEKALKDLDTEKQIRKRAEIYSSELKLTNCSLERKLAQMTTSYDNLLHQFNQQKLLQSLNVNNHSMGANNNNNNSDMKSNFMRYILEKMIPITETSNGCRVVSFYPRNSAILVSQPSNNAIFPGFGIKKINIHDYKLSQYIPIHSKLIRDIAVNTTQQDDGIILTCGLDKTIKLTNLANNALVHSFECPHPVWSCTYNLDDSTYFFAGMSNGHVLLFDKRRIDRHVDILNGMFDMGAPVCNLQYVSKNEESTFTQSGLLVAQLDKLSFFEANQIEEYKYHPLLVESSIMSCCYEPISRNILLTTRPSQKHSTVRHLIYEFKPTTTNTDDETNLNVSLNLTQTFLGSNVQKILARSKLFTHDSKLFGCASDEASKSIVIWDVNRNEICTKLSNMNEVLDICPIPNINKSSFIVSLADKQLRIFKKTN